MVIFKYKLKLYELITLIVLILLIFAIPLTVYLVKQQQIFKSKAIGETTASCSNKLIFGLNGPVSSKIKELYTNPSIRFFAVAWGAIQPSQSSSYNFSSVDAEVNEAIQNGQTPVVKFCDGDCFPDWARQMDKNVDWSYCCANETVCRVLKDDSFTVTAFQDVVRAMVLRYKDKIHEWDYGIEPNCRGYNPALYTQWLRYFTEAVRSADPNAIVIGGHLSGGNNDYLRAMYENGARPYFDKISLDPYGAPLNYGAIEGARNIMVANGDENKKIWLGEWAIASENDEARQAVLIEEGLNYLAGKPWIEAAFYHNFECGLEVSSCTPGSQYYLGFSLLRSDGTVKPAYDVFKNKASACLTPAGSIGGRVWEDSDSNHTINGTERALGGMAVYLDTTANFQTTNDQGFYVFQNVPVGSHKVFMAQSDLGSGNWTATTPLSVDVSIVEEAQNNVSFGLRSSSSPVPSPTFSAGGVITGVVWDDTKGGIKTPDGIRQPDEPLLAGVRVCVNPGVQSCDVSTNNLNVSNGNYKLSGIPIGKHTVYLGSIPAGWIPIAFNQRLTEPQILESGKTVNAHFYFKSTAVVPTSLPTSLPTQTPTTPPASQPPATDKPVSTDKPQNTALPLLPDQIKFDLNSDERINSIDVAMFLSGWRNRDFVQNFDFNNDSVLNSIDYALIRRNLRQ